LDKRRIHRGLFSKIIHLDGGEGKDSYVSTKNSIFIDDSFAERVRVAERCGIPVFDVSNIEALLDWRV